MRYRLAEKPTQRKQKQYLKKRYCFDRKDLIISSLMTGTIFQKYLKNSNCCLDKVEKLDISYKYDVI